MQDCPPQEGAEDKNQGYQYSPEEQAQQDHHIQDYPPQEEAEDEDQGYKFSHWEQPQQESVTSSEKFWEQILLFIFPSSPLPAYAFKWYVVDFSDTLPRPT